MKHPGTYNANPLSAAAGIAALKQVATGEPCDKANAAARRLRNKLNELFEAREWPWVAYGDFSMVRVLPGYRGERPSTTAGDQQRPGAVRRRREQTGRPEEHEDVPRDASGDALERRGLVGLRRDDELRHTDAVIDHTLTAFDASIEMLTAEGLG